jgi:hypothetical protein
LGSRSERFLEVLSKLPFSIQFPEVSVTLSLRLRMPAIGFGAGTSIYTLPFWFYPHYLMRSQNLRVLTILQFQYLRVGDIRFSAIWDSGMILGSFDYHQVFEDYPFNPISGCETVLLLSLSSCSSVDLPI